MAEGLNRVLLLGNLGADPETHGTGNAFVLKLRLATSETYLDRNKQRQERTEWHSVTVWGKRGEALSKFLKKGDRLFIEGGLRTSNFTDRQGQKRYKTEVVATSVLLNGKGNGASPSAGKGDAYEGDDYGGDYGPDPL